MNVHLPVFQRFDCHGCVHCCRHLMVVVSESQRRRLIDAGWPDRLPGLKLFEPYRTRAGKAYRLAHRPEGGCVFLNEQGQCRIHVEDGFGAKPLACRLYPFVPTPAPNDVRLDLRFDCPSVAGNKGRGLSAHQAAINAMAEEAGARPVAEAAQWPNQRSLSGDELTALAKAFDRILQAEGLPVRSRWHAGTLLLDMLYEVTIRAVTGDRFAELVEMLAEAVLAEMAGATDGSMERSSMLSPRAAKLFGQWLFLHGLTEDPSELRIGLVRRLGRSWGRYRQSRRFARWRGSVPRVADTWPDTDFQTVEQVKPAPDEALEPVLRAMRLKLDSRAFCGPGFLDCNVLSGLSALWLMPALAGWFSRLEAVADGRQTLTAEDVLAGLRRVHHTFGVSPAFHRLSERLRLKAMARPGVVASILARFGP